MRKITQQFHNKLEKVSPHTNTKERDFTEYLSQIFLILHAKNSTKICLFWSHSDTVGEKGTKIIYKECKLKYKEDQTNDSHSSNQR